jgi:DNA polymerase-1
MKSLEMKSNLLDLAKKAGLVPRWAASTQNGEYHSACPQCGGKDRFIIQPNRLARNGILGCFFCRQCRENGDSLSFCMKFLQLNKADASHLIQCPSREILLTSHFQDQHIRSASSLWLDWAKSFCHQCHHGLLQNEKAQKLIQARGLKLDTVVEYQIGYSSKNSWVDRAFCGLPPSQSSQKHFDNFFLPQGLVIPYIKDGQVVKIKVRRENWLQGSPYSKYILMPGSQSIPFLSGSLDLPLVIVEAELDAILLAQEAGDICSVLATGGASCYPDTDTDKMLKKVDLMLFALDFDEAGKKAFIAWRSAYPKVCPWPTPYAKSPADACLSGVNLREWVKSGIEKYRKPKPKLELSIPTFKSPILRPQEIAIQFTTAPQAIEEEVRDSSPQQSSVLAGIAVEYIDQEEQAKQAIASLLSFQQLFGLDIETYGDDSFSSDKQAGLDPKKSLIRLVQIFDGVKTVYIFDIKKLTHFHFFEPLADRPMLAHNALFEMKHLLHKGVLFKKMGCTLLADRVLNGDRKELRKELGLASSATLKNLAKELLQLEISKEMQISDWSQEQLSLGQLEYAAIDAILPVKLFAIQWEQLQKRNLTRSYQLLRDAQYPIARLELTGIAFNIDQHAVLMAEWEREKLIIEESIFTSIGRKLNINSSKQLGKWIKEALKQQDLDIWAITAQGQLSTSTTTLRLHESKNELFPKIIKYRQLAKLIGSFGQGLYKFIDMPNQRLYGSFYLGNTATGRMSSFNPNMQNMPKGEFRSLFCARTGYSLVGLDYSQQELRVAAMLTQDPELLRVYLEKGDIHVNTVASLLKLPKERVGKEQRQLAKAVIFGLLYGQGASGLASYAKQQYNVKMTLEEADIHIKEFFKLYPGLRRWQRKTAKAAEVSKKIRTPCGRERDFSRERTGYRYTAALNLPIQGAAAEITLHALIRLTSLLCDDCRLVNVVHDEILLEVVDDRCAEFMEKAAEAMEQAFLDVFPESKPYLAGLVEAKIGKTWAETK